MNTNSIKSINRFLHSSKPTVFALGLLMVAVIGSIDAVTGYEVSLSIFYLVPIVWVTWMLGGRYGGIFSVLSIFAWFIADEVIFPHEWSHHWIPYWNGMIRGGFFGVVVSLLVTLKDALIREKEFARRDFSTGIANSQAFYEYARIEIDRSRRYKHPVAVAYMDCDNFKSVNDTFGHHVGDQLLRRTGKFLQESVRKSDIVARLGGDEFAILLPETGPEAAQEVVQKIREQLVNLMKENNWPVTFSVGLVTFISAPDTVDEMIQIADAYMYAAKKSGKNKINHDVFNRTNPPRSLLEVLAEQAIGDGSGRLRRKQ